MAGVNTPVEVPRPEGHWQAPEVWEDTGDNARFFDA